MEVNNAPSLGLISENKDITLSVPCYVVEHVNGRLLWNGGYLKELVDNRVTIGPEKPFIEQLKQLNLDASSFDYFTFSHAHYDHAGTMSDLARGTFLVQKMEYEHSIVNDSRYEKLISRPRILLDGDYDVFGDATVRIISAPGHTPGHQMLYVALENHGPILLSGDLYHLQSSFDYKVVLVYTFNHQLLLDSMTRANKILKETGAKLWIEHDNALFKKLKKASLYYD